MLCRNEHLPYFIKESVAQLPQLKRFVRIILIFDLAQTCFAEAIQVRFKLFPSYQLKLATDFFRKAISLTDIIQNREEDNEQFFIKVDLSLFIDWIQIYRSSILDDSSLRTNCSCPIDFVQATMQVLHNEKEETLVVTVEL